MAAAVPHLARYRKFCDAVASSASDGGMSARRVRRRSMLSSEPCGSAARHLSSVLRAFFNDEHDVVAYPWVLTMVAALHAGSNSARVNGSNVILDHDADIAVFAPGKDRDYAVALLGRLVSLARARDIEAGIGRPTLSEYVSLEKLDSFTALITSTYASTFRSDPYPHIEYNLSPNGPGASDENAFAAPPLVLTLNLQPMQPDAHDDMWKWTASQDFFFFFDAEPPHETRSVFWEGEAWPFPASEERFLAHFYFHVMIVFAGHEQMPQQMNKLPSFWKECGLQPPHPGMELCDLRCPHEMFVEQAALQPPCARLPEATLRLCDHSLHLVLMDRRAPTSEMVAAPATPLETLVPTVAAIATLIGLLFSRLRRRWSTSTYTSRQQRQAAAGSELTPVAIEAG